MTQHLIPAPNFGMIEEDLYRSGQPDELNFPFLEKLKLKTIVYLSPEKPPALLCNFAIDHNIRLEHIIGGSDGLTGSSVSEEIVLRALAEILDTTNYPLLVTCNLGRHHTGTVVGCLRKLQKWNLTSIFEEYRRHAANKVRLLNEQFIEFFDTDLVTVPADKPDWLQ